MQIIILKQDGSWRTFSDEVGAVGIGIASDVQPPVWPAVRISGAGPRNQWGDFFHIAHTHPSGGEELPFWGLRILAYLNGWLSVIINSDMLDIYLTMPDS